MPPEPFSQEVLYFAYGADLSRAHLALWCPAARPLLKAALRDWRLVFRQWADLVPSPGDAVPGGLYEMDPRDLQALDECMDSPALYHQITICVETPAGPASAVGYRMNPGHPLALPDADYLDLILRGYADWNLDPAALADLKPGPKRW